MNVEIGTETPIFLFWEYLFQIFGFLSLQCAHLWSSPGWTVGVAGVPGEGGGGGGGEGRRLRSHAPGKPEAVPVEVGHSTGQYLHQTDGSQELRLRQDVMHCCGLLYKNRFLHQSKLIRTKTKWLWKILYGYSQIWSLSLDFVIALVRLSIIFLYYLSLWIPWEIRKCREFWLLVHGRKI